MWFVLSGLIYRTLVSLILLFYWPGYFWYYHCVVFVCRFSYCLYFLVLRFELLFVWLSFELFLLFLAFALFCLLGLALYSNYSLCIFCLLWCVLVLFVLVILFLSLFWFVCVFFLLYGLGSIVIIPSAIASTRINLISNMIISIIRAATTIRIDRVTHRRIHFLLLLRFPPKCFNLLSLCLVCFAVFLCVVIIVIMHVVVIVIRVLLIMTPIPPHHLFCRIRPSLDHHH